MTQTRLHTARSLFALYLVKLLNCAARNALQSPIRWKPASPSSQPFSVQSADSFTRTKKVAGDLKVCFLQQQASEGKTPAQLALYGAPPSLQPQAYSSQLCINTPKQKQTQISIWIQSTQRKVGPIKHLIANYGIMFGLQQTVKSYGTTTVAAYGSAFKVSPQR